MSAASAEGLSQPDRGRRRLLFSRWGSPPGSCLQPRSPSSPTPPGTWSQTQFLATIATWPIWLRASAAMVVGEIGYYWGHRVSHEVPFLWRFHAIHHSAKQIDFLVSTRAHPVDFVFTQICMLTPLYALGLVGAVHVTDSTITMTVLLAGIVWGYFVHANLRWQLSPLEWIIATPGFHHWHHTYGLQRNCNYASMLPWIDRLFGSHYLPKVWPSRYGIPEPMATPRPADSSSSHSRTSATPPRRRT